MSLKYKKSDTLANKHHAESGGQAQPRPVRNISPAKNLLSQHARDGTPPADRGTKEF